MLALNRRSTHTWAEVQSIKRLYEAGVYHLPPPEEIATALLLHHDFMPELRTRTATGRRPEQAARKRDQPETYPKGRVCAERSCKTILSIYHAGPFCHACKPTRRFTMLSSVEGLRQLMEEAA